MKLTKWPIDITFLDKEDIHLIATKAHPWQIDLALKNDIKDKADWFSLPQPYMQCFHDVELNYIKGVGKYGKGYAKASYTITENDPWFWCHFLGDPVMPGAQGQDGFAQLGGMWAAGSCEVIGRGRALSGAFEYYGQVLPTAKKIYFHLNVKRFLKKKKLVFFDGYMSVDDPENMVYQFGEHKVGFFTREELSIPDGAVSEYYKPDWNQLKSNAESWIKEAKTFYDENK